jgi:RNA polymerase sigma-70 factor, ECF subfamily
MDSATTDETLMQAVAGGQVAAFEQLVLRHQQAAWGTAYRMLGCRQTAEDIAQEAFLRIYQAADRYQPSAAFRTYLYRIVVRLCLDCLRKKRPMVAEDIQLLDESAEGPEHILLLRERDEAVRTALNQLPAKQRTAVVLRYYEGLSGCEIAEVLQTTTKAVERLLARGRSTLERRLASYLQP